MVLDMTFLTVATSRLKITVIEIPLLIYTLFSQTLQATSLHKGDKEVS